MNRSASIAERIVVAVWVLVTALWSVFALDVILAYRSSTAASTWSARLIMIAVAAAVTIAVVLLVRTQWRRVLNTPLKGGRGSRWIIQRPGWQIAGLYWIILGLPPLAANIWQAHTEHHLPSAGMLATMCAVSIIGSSFLALTMRAIWRRKAENAEVPPGRLCDAPRGETDLQ